MSDVFRILILGDIVGRPARNYIASNLKAIISSRDIDFVIANGENATSGAGITRSHAEEIHSAGVDVITLGDHTWDQKNFSEAIDSLNYVVRPANLNKIVPGKGHVITKKAGKKILISTFLGKHFMKISANCPFTEANEILKQHKNDADISIFEIHAEATSEKIAFGWMLDGQADIVFGTHTHVQTADERLLPKGTAYITDLGMCGPHESVIGREISPVLNSFLTGMYNKFSVAENDIRLNGIIVDFDNSTNRPIKIQRVSFN